MTTREQASPDVLYFPHIEIKDTEWLKGALCIWDSVHRIVPEGYQPKDSTEVKQAIDAGAIRNVTLSMGDLKEAREGYHEFLDDVVMLPDAIDRRADGHTVIHQAKLDEVMRSELSDLIGTITRHGDWLELPRGLADGYLLFLADAVARRRAIPKVTDSDTMFVAMQYFAMDGNMDEFGFNSEGDASTALMLRYVAPAGIGERPMSEVLKFRKANVDGRRAFRRAVDELVARMSQVKDEEYARAILGDFIKNLQESEKITPWPIA